MTETNREEKQAKKKEEKKKKKKDEIPKQLLCLHLDVIICWALRQMSGEK